MRVTVTEPPLPSAALLRRFVDSGDYTDCFMTSVEEQVSFPAYAEAFYTTTVFKAERFILRWLASRPSTDADVRALANGQASTFAAWKLLDRSDDQMLLMDTRGRTCSWLMCIPGEKGTRLYFGSAVIRSRKTESGRRPGWTYRCLLGLHRLYSRILLRAAGRRVTRMHQARG